MEIIIQKFGGTSVATQDLLEMAAGKIITAIKKGFKPVVVVSAPGRKGSPYATDTLISMVEEISSNIDLRDLDLLMSCGEIVSCVLMVATLTKHGYKARAFTGAQAGILTDDNFGHGKIKKIEPLKILDTLKDGLIPVVAGFQGVTKSGDITTLGRGGSDTTAGALGLALNAVAIEIYTDVDGIATADPRIVPDAKILDVITYNEIFQLANEGAKVIHPKAVEYAMCKFIPIYIKNTFNDRSGTKISLTGTNGENFDLLEGRLIAGITYVKNLTQVVIDFSEEKEIQRQRELFNGIAERKISVDMINLYPDIKRFIIKEEDYTAAVEFFKKYKFKASFRRNCSKITAIGSGMRGIPGVMAQIVDGLSKANIEVLQTSDSHLTISCLVKGEDTEEAVRALCKEFNLKGCEI